jgi:hypothetical protein
MMNQKKEFGRVRELKTKPVDKIFVEIKEIFGSLKTFKRSVDRHLIILLKCIIPIGLERKMFM